MGLLQRFSDGGVFMYFILVFFLLTVGFITERALALYKNLQAPAPDLRKNLLSFIGKADLSSGLDYVESTSKNTALGRIAWTGLRARLDHRGDEELQARMDERLSTEISQIDRRTGFLAMFGNVSTLLGLLGTIIGMIRSFSGVAAATPADRATMLAQGISESLNCTGFGLLAAIPALVAFAIFQNRTDRYVTELSEGAAEIYHDLLFYTESGSPSRSVIAEPNRRSLESNA